MRDLNNRDLFSHSSGGWKSENKVSEGLVSPEAFLLGFRGPLSHCVLMWSFLSGHLCKFPLLRKTTVVVGEAYPNGLI